MAFSKHSRRAARTWGSACALTAVLASTGAALPSAQAAERLAGASPGDAGSTTYALATEALPRLHDGMSSRLEVVRWAPASRGDWGLALGAQRDGNGPVMPGLGLRWRSRLDEGRRLDLAAWRHFDASADPNLRFNDPPPLVSSRIELQFGAQPPRRALDSAIGLQLGRSDSGLSMRLRGGKPMLYYRMQF